MTTIRYFAAAAEAAGADSEQLDLRTVGDAIAHMRTRGALAEVLPRCALVVDGVRHEHHETDAPAGDLIDVLPPFAGG